MIRLPRYWVFAISLAMLGLSHASPANAEFYFELGVEDGGKTMASASGTTIYGYETEQDLNLGGGGKWSLGMYYTLGENEDRSLTIAVGQLEDSLSASNGKASFETSTFNVIYSFHFEAHHLGIGGTYHSAPVYEDKVDSFPRFELEFEDTGGLILQYGYAYLERFQIGLRYTIMEYETNDEDFDASSLGLFLAFVI